MTSSAPRRWARFLHLSPRGFMDYAAAIRRAGRGGAVDVDVQPSREGDPWALHWPKVGRNGLHDPAGRIKASRRVDTLTNAELSRLRGPRGQRIHSLAFLLDLADRRGVRVETELKAYVTEAHLRKLVARPSGRRLLAAGHWQAKRLASMGHVGVVLGPAHRAGIPTILSFTGYRGRGVPSAFKKYVDYTRGRPRWK